MVDSDAVRQAYDEIATAYTTQRETDGRGTAILGEFCDRLGDDPTLLDAGCGSGTPVLARTTESAEAVGLDVSRGQLRLAEDNAPGAALVQGDMTRLPFAADAFDAVVAYWSLIHVPLPDHRTVVDEFARVLRPGGRLLVCEGTDEWVGENPDWLDTGVEMAWEIAGAEATREQLRGAGFTVTDEWGVPDSLDPDDDSDSWTFFAARLA